MSSCARLAALAVASLLAAGFAPPSAAQSCPASTVTLGVGVSSISSAAVFDTSAVNQGEVRWDMTVGNTYLFSAGSLSGLFGDVYDDFDVTGVPAGTPVNVVAELTVDGAVWTPGCGGSGCGGYYWVRFYHGTDSLVVQHSDHLYSGRLDHHDVVQLAFTIVAGQPERLRIQSHGARTPGGSHLSEANCVLRFRDLPAGVDITSCKGFVGMAVPALPTSWGRLKRIYR